MVAKVSWVLLLVGVCAAAYFKVFYHEEATGSGRVVVEERLSLPFDKVAVDGHVNLHVKRGDKIHVQVQTDDSLMPYVETKVKQGRLHVGLRPAYRNLGKWASQKEITVVVTLPELTGITLNGSGDVVGYGEWPFQQMEVEINGSGNVTLSLLGEKLVAAIRGSGGLALKGMALRQDVFIHGSGDYLASGLQGESALVNISGSGKASLDVTNTLDIQLSGSGNVLYSGSPRVNLQVSGSGQIIRL